MRSAISFLMLTATLRTFAAFLCVCFAVPASAKLGEPVTQLIKSFGKSYTIESDTIGGEV